MTTSENAAYDANIRDATNSRRHEWRCWDCSRFVKPGVTRCLICHLEYEEAVRERESRDKP